MLFALAGLAVPFSAAATPIEYAVKATYLSKFAPFIEWPTTAFTSKTSPFNLCVLGDDPFGQTLDQAVNGLRVGDHPMFVKRLDRMDGAEACHILYVGGSAKMPAAEAVRRVRGAPILTVTDESRGGSGGIIQFVLREGRVRFEIDAAAATASQIVISSKLLSLALSVRPRG